jgi:L-ascorbate metabolism protein UlaG (beta-lactamase superfamily)
MIHPNCKITHLDTAMVLIEVGGFRFLTDPVFDSAGTDYHHGPIHLQKTSAALLQPQQLGVIDAVLLSHDQHADNLDHGGRAFLPQAGRVLTTTEGAERLGGNATGLEPWQTTMFKHSNGFEVKVTAMPAQHGPDGTIEATGPVIGFLLEWPGQIHGALYVSGDTILHRGTTEIVERGGIGTAILHLGRVQLAPMGMLEFSLSASDAVRYAEQLGLQAVMPVHTEGWAHFSEGEAAAREIFDNSPLRDRVRWLVPGEATEIEV